jgi:hypothetical protein
MPARPSGDTTRGDVQTAAARDGFERLAGLRDKVAHGLDDQRAQARDDPLREELQGVRACTGKIRGAYLDDRHDVGKHFARPGRRRHARVLRRVVWQIECPFKRIGRRQKG